MAMICNDCGGIIPDVMFNGKRRCDCKNHIQPEVNIKLNLDKPTTRSVNIKYGK